MKYTGSEEPLQKAWNATMRPAIGAGIVVGIGFTLLAGLLVWGGWHLAGIVLAWLR